MPACTIPTSPVFTITANTKGSPFWCRNCCWEGRWPITVADDRLTYCAAAQLVRTAAEAIHYAHRNGVVHRDLKPANLLLSADGVPKVIDFGLAKTLDSDGGFTRTGETPGTPSYMAPEQITGASVGPHTDIYGLGAILYELLYDVPPFSGGSSATVFERILKSSPKPPRVPSHRVPADLRAITFKCLEKEPQHRYSSAADVADDLGRFLADEPVRARNANVFAHGWKWTRRQPTTAALVGAVALAVIVLVIGSIVSSVRLARLAREAEVQRQEAVSRRSEAEQRQQALRHQLYAADISAAYKAYEQNNIVQMREFLQRYVPASADDDLRSFPWYLLDRLLHSEQVSLPGHQGEVYSVLYAPDGRHLATCGQDGTVRLWNAKDGTPLAVFAAHPCEANCIAFTPDGSNLASVGDDGLVYLWNVSAALSESTHGVVHVQPQEPLANLTWIVRAVAISPDGTVLAAGGNERTIELIPLGQQATRRTLAAQRSSVTSLLFSRDGKSLYSVAGADLCRWDIAKGTAPIQRCKHEANINAICLSHDGRLLVSADSNGRVTWHDPESLAVDKKMNAGHGRIDALAFSPDDRTLAIGSIDRHCQLWDVATGTLRNTIRGHSGAIWSVEYSPDGTSLATASADGLARIWKASSPGGSRLATNPNPYSAIAFSSDRPVLVAGTGNQLELWDWQSARQLRASHVETRAQPTKPPAGINALAFSPDGGEIASSHHDGGVRLWDSELLTKRGELFGLVADAASLSYSPDGRYLAVGSGTMSGCARIWQRDNKQSSPVSGSWGSDWVQNASTGQRLLLGSHYFRSVQEWRAGQVKQAAMAFGQGQASCYACADDGRLLATGGGAGDRGIYLWDTATGRLIATFGGHRAQVNSVAFCPDNRTLASTSQDGTIRLWDLIARQELITIELAGAQGIACSFSPDGSALGMANTSSDGTGELYVWSTSTATAKPAA